MAGGRIRTDDLSNNSPGDVTFVTFFGDKKCDASHLSHFWEECDALSSVQFSFIFKSDWGPDP